MLAFSFAASIAELNSFVALLYSWIAALPALMCGSASACCSPMNFFRQSVYAT